MLPLILATLAGAAWVYFKGKSADTTGGGIVTNEKPIISSIANPFSLPDIDPYEQGGKWTRLFDDAFREAKEKYGVPFALLKAHAIRESALKDRAIRNEPAKGSRPVSASYGLMQILWWPGSNRFARYGMPDDYVKDGSILFTPHVNVNIAAQLIADNFKTYKTLRDTINAYNTGVKESVRVAPGNYVDDVLKIYSTLINKTVV